MSNPQQDLVDKLEKENLEDVTIYTVELGYHKFSTDNKETAYTLWQSLSEGFFELTPLGSGYENPKFLYRKPIEVKLSSEKTQVWKTIESATRAHNAFKALASRAEVKEE